MKKPTRNEYSEWSTCGQTILKDEYITALEWYIECLEDKLKIEKIENPEEYRVTATINEELQDEIKERDVKSEILNKTVIKWKDLK